MYFLLFFAVAQTLLLGWLARILIVAHADARAQYRATLDMHKRILHALECPNLAEDGRHIGGRS